MHGRCGPQKIHWVLNAFSEQTAIFVAKSAKELVKFWKYSSNYLLPDSSSCDGQKLRICLANPFFENRIDLSKPFCPKLYCIYSLQRIYCCTRCFRGISNNGLTDRNRFQWAQDFWQSSSLETEHHGAPLFPVNVSLSGYTHLDGFKNRIQSCTLYVIIDWFWQYLSPLKLKFIFILVFSCLERYHCDTLQIPGSPIHPYLLNEHQNDFSPCPSAHELLGQTLTDHFVYSILSNVMTSLVGAFCSCRAQMSTLGGTT